MSFESPQGYAFTARELEQATIAARISSQWKKCDPLQVDAAKQQVFQEKRASDSAVQVSEDWLQHLRERKQALLRLSDAAQLEGRIQAKVQERSRIREETQKGISALSFKAVYGVVLLDSAVDRTKKRDLQAQAQASLTAVAIPEQRGHFLTSETVVQNGFLKEDKILMESSGELETEEEWLSHPLRSQGKFLYLAKVQIRPLSGTASLVGDAEASKSQAVVLDMSGSFPDSALQACGLTPADIRRFREVLPNGYQEEIQEERQRAARQIRSFEARRLELEAKLAKELTELHRQEEECSRQVSLHLRWLGKTIPNRLPDAHRLALAAIELEIQDEMARKVEAKEREPVAVWMRIVPSQNAPSEDIAQSVMGTLEQLQQGYGSVQRFLQVAETRNSLLVRDETLQWQDWSRTLDRVSVLVVPRDDNDYHVSVVGQFALQRKLSLPAVTPRRLQRFVGSSEAAPQLPSEPEATRQASPIPTAVAAPVTPLPAPMGPKSVAESDRTTCRTCWLAGGLAVGAGATAAILLLTGKDGSSSSATAPASNKSSVEATW